MVVAVAVEIMVAISSIVIIEAVLELVNFAEVVIAIDFTADFLTYSLLLAAFGFVL